MSSQGQLFASPPQAALHRLFFAWLPDAE